VDQKEVFKDYSSEVLTNYSEFLRLQHETSLMVTATIFLIHEIYRFSSQNLMPLLPPRSKRLCLASVELSDSEAGHIAPRLSFNDKKDRTQE